MRDLAKLVDQPYHMLLDVLIDNTADRASVEEELSFMRRELLGQKADLWHGSALTDTYQKADRVANYGTVDTTTEIIRLEAEQRVLEFEHEIIVRMIDATHQ